MPQTGVCGFLLILIPWYHGIKIATQQSVTPCPRILIED